ncbi:hypothetical protein E4T42_09264 [Aureobasidium subglaciale]|nr:hypothetical protein E4T42_09264 [Aureobasidium subglaciale]
MCRRYPKHTVYASSENGIYAATTSSSASLAFNVLKDFDARYIIYAVVMCLTFVIMFLLGALLLRLLSVRVHYLNITSSIYYVIFKRIRKSTRLGKIHLYLSPMILVLGIVNAPLGLILG